MANHYLCDYGYGICTAPDTCCPHWQGTFCELVVPEETGGKETDHGEENE